MFHFAMYISSLLFFFLHLTIRECTVQVFCFVVSFFCLFVSISFLFQLNSTVIPRRAIAIFIARYLQNVYSCIGVN